MKSYESGMRIDRPILDVHGRPARPFRRAGTKISYGLFRPSYLSFFILMPDQEAIVLPAELSASGLQFVRSFGRAVELF